MGSPGSVSTDHNVILFDGVCNLCNGVVQFIITRDKRNVFRFASLQSEYGKRALSNFGLDGEHLRTIFLVQSTGVLQQSDAVLEIARNLTSGWSFLYGFKIVPRFLRDFIYRMIANNRYRMFGRTESCMIPTAELAHRFVG